MSGVPTIANAHDYWRRYYAEEFHFGLGTERILAALNQIPPVDTWVDLGAGSESLMWAIALRARQLVAVDVDPHRLARLQLAASTARPRGAHTTALQLCGRAHPDDFSMRCRSLAATVTADCLGPDLPPDPHLVSGTIQLVTQFGLLGLCRDSAHFTASFAALHGLLAPDGWAAGSNWVARDISGRVRLTERLYQDAADHAGVTLLRLERIASADPDFPAVWIYVGQTRRTP